MTDDEAKPLSQIFGANAEPAKALEPKVADPKATEQSADPAKGDSNSGGTPPPDADEKDKKQDPPKKDDPLKVMRKALNATQRELAQLRQERQQKPASAPDPITDAEGYSKHIQQTVSDAVWQERLADAHEDLSEKLGDAYDETLETFQEMMAARPQLFAEWRNSRNPGKFLLKAVEDHRAKAEIGDPAKFADRIRAETRKEMMSEVEKLVSEGIKKALGQSLPKSLADEQTQGDGREDAEAEEFKPKPLSQILGKRK